MGRPIVEPPKTVGLWTVYARAEDHVGKVRYPMFRCVCECGTERNIAAQSLRRGDAYSCGCKHKPPAPGQAKRSKPKGNVKHGLRNSVEYSTWVSMKQRCLNPNSENYSNYGGRGITVCEEWKDSFLAFFNYVGPRPEGTSLDRIEVNGNYEPGNVRWATEEEQCNNRTNARTITSNGKTQTIAQWSRETGVAFATIHARLKRGWPPEKALDPFVSQTKDRVIVSKRTRMIEHGGKTQNLTEWAKETGINYATLCDRLNSGWSVERALTTL